MNRRIELTITDIGELRLLQQKVNKHG